MKKIFSIYLLFLIILLSCNSNKNEKQLTENEKNNIQTKIEFNIAKSIDATRMKDIEAYMSHMPDDFVIYDEGGDIISREKQKENVLRDWAIIDTTLHIKMDIDSIQFLEQDSIIVFTSQSWVRMMFQRDGITTDTVLTTQRHKETWKKRNNNWYGYEVLELGGKIFINGEIYNPQN